MKQLYEVLYRVIEVSQQEIKEEYTTSLESPSNDYFAMLLENISEAENFKKEVQRKLDIERDDQNEPVLQDADLINHLRLRRKTDSNSDKLQAFK